jgi:serine protease
MVRGDPGRHDYLAFQGTSMAAPHVAGAAALLRAEGISHPGTIEALLERSAKDKRDRRRYGAGLLQVADALSLARRGLGGLRGLAAVVFGLIMLAGLRRSGRLDVSPPLALVTGAVVAGALGAVAELGRSFLGVDLGTWATGQGPILELAREAGASGGLGVLSGVLPLVAVALLLGVRRLRSALAGVCLGFAAVLAVEAILPTLHLAGGPWVVGPWLLCHAALALGLGRLVSIRSPAK